MLVLPNDDKLLVMRHRATNDVYNAQFTNAEFSFGALLDIAAPDDIRRVEYAREFSFPNPQWLYTTFEFSSRVLT